MLLMFFFDNSFIILRGEDDDLAQEIVARMNNVEVSMYEPMTFKTSGNERRKRRRNKRHLFCSVASGLHKMPPCLPENDALVNDDFSFQLLESARCGDLQTVKKIITLHPNYINCRYFDKRNVTPLHLAAGISLVLGQLIGFR